MAIQDLSGYGAVPETGEMFAPADVAALVASAERELGAFMKAVTDAFGPEEGRLAAEDWLEELESPLEHRGVSADDWRSITIAAASRLAKRLSAASVV